MKEIIDNIDKKELLDINQIYLQLIKEPNFSKLIILNQEKYSKSQDYELETEYINKNILDYKEGNFLSEIDKKTGEIISYETLNQEGEEILKLYIEKKYTEIFKKLSFKEISFFGINKYFKDEFNLKEIFEWLVSDEVKEMDKKLLSSEQTRVFEVLQNKIINASEEELENIIEYIPEITKTIKEVADENNQHLEYVPLIKYLFYANISLMKIKIEKKKGQELIKLYKDFINLKNEIGIRDRYKNHLKFLLDREEEHSNFKAIKPEELDYVFIEIIKNYSDEELQKLLTDEDFYISGNGFDINLLENINYEEMSETKKMFLNFYSFNNIEDIEIYIKTFEDFINLINFEKNMIVTNNNSSWNKIGELSKEALLKKPKYIIKLLQEKELSEQEKEILKNIIDLNLNAFSNLEILLKKSELYPIEELFEYFIKAIMHNRNYGFSSKNENEIISEWIKYFDEKGIKEKEIIDFFIENIEETETIAKYILENINKFENNKELLEKIREKYKDNKDITKKIYEIDNEKDSANTNERKQLIKYDWRTKNIYKTNPQFFKEIFEDFEKLIKNKEEDKIFVSNIIKIINEAIYTKKIPVDEEGKKTTDYHPYTYKEEHYYDKNLLKILLKIHKTENVKEKIELLKKAYIKIEKIKMSNNDINENIDIKTFEMFVSALYPYEETQIWMANYLSSNRWDNMIQTDYEERYDPKTQKTNPDDIFDEKGIKFFYEIIEYIKKSGIKSERFDLNELMIDNYYKLKEMSKEEQIQFIKKFEQKEKETRHTYDEEKEFNKLFSWIILNKRLPKDEKLFDNIEEVSTFNLKEYSKFLKLMNEIHIKLDKKYKDKIISKLSKEEKNHYLENFKQNLEEKLSENDQKTNHIIKQMIEEKYNKMNLFKEYGIYAFQIIKKTLKDKTSPEIVTSFIKKPENQNKYANYKNFELNYSNEIDLKQLKNYIDMKPMLDKIKKLPKGKEKYIELLKGWLKILENDNLYTIEEFQEYLKTISDDENVIMQIEEGILNIKDIIKKRNYVDYTEMAEIFGDKIFEKNKTFLKSNKLNKILENYYLTKETQKIFKNENLDIKHGTDYLIKTKVGEILKSPDILDIKEENNEQYLKFKKKKEEIEELKEEIEEKMQKAKKERIVDDWFSKETLKRLKKKKLLQHKEVVKKKLTDETDECYKQEGENKLKEIEFKLEMKDKIKELEQKEEEIEKIEYKEIKELTDEELIKYLYYYAKNEYFYLAGIIKLLIENKLELQLLDKILKEKQIPSEIEKEYFELKEKYENNEFIKGYKQIDIKNSIAKKMKTYKVPEKTLLEKLEIETQDFILKIKNIKDNDFLHINRTKGMLNCAAFSDIGENVIWTILLRPEINGMLEIKDKKEEKTVFSSYIKLLKSEENKDKELLIDNIEGNKEYKAKGIKAYQEFIKEIIKSQLKLFKEGKKLTVDKITISNNYSKLYAEEINKDIKQLKEYQNISTSEYSDAKKTRIELFNIKDFLSKHPNITKEQIDKLKFKTENKKALSEQEQIRKEIKEIIKETRERKKYKEKQA